MAGGLVGSEQSKKGRLGPQIPGAWTQSVYEQEVHMSLQAEECLVLDLVMGESVKPIRAK